MKNLDYYEGQVLNGKFDGKGKLTTWKGVIAEGTFNNGQLEGEVHVSLPDGRKYILQVKDGIAIETKLIKEKSVKVKPRSPYSPGPGVNPKPKGSIFPFLGMDFNAE
jgi:hypothetical protein